MSEKLSFQAEVQQLLDLVVHSLYSDREIFLRELVSNASDALDRARFQALSRSDLRPAEGEPQITLAFSKEKGTITISDNGIGLSREEAIEHLGTIARSGTRAFAKALKERGTTAEGLIGQFGVGFYASFMVAHRVEVESLSAEPGAEPVHWESDGGGTFEVAPGKRATRGTDVTLHLRSDAQEFADQYRLKEIVEKHSDFVQYPVMLESERMNQSSALWTRNPKEVTEEEYTAFYKHISNDWQNHGFHVHFRSEAPLEFSAVLYVPGSRPFDLDYPDAKRGLRLYQRRVMILEHAEAFLPRYLRFARGVVDAPEVSLNISREILQQTPVIGAIKKQIVKRLLRRIGEVAKDDAAEGTDNYTKFWENFGTTLKEGVSEDGDNKETILPLLRFRTTTSEGWRDFASIKADLKEGQDAIWYMTGSDLEKMKSNPQLERFRKKGYEVILLSDPVDEWVVMNVPSFETVPLKSIARGEFKDEEDPIAEEARKQAAPFVSWLGDLLKGQVDEVRASGRLTDSPAVLVDGDGGVSANLERILKSARQDAPKARRILEVNPEHPLVRKLTSMHEAKADETAEPIARLLLDYARVAEGSLEDTAGFAKRLAALMLQASGS
jgi:molecular chaperone HtpG